MKRLVLLLIFLILNGCAIKELGKSVKPGQINMVENLDTILIKLDNEKNFDAIIEIYNQRQDEFNNPKLVQYVVKSYFNKKQYKELIQLIEKKQEIFKKVGQKDLELLRMLGISYYMVGNSDQALRFLEIIKEETSNEEVFIYLALLYLKKGQYSYALVTTSKLQDRKRELIQGLIHMEMKNWHRALEMFEKAKFQSEKVALYKAYCYYMMGNINMAEKLVNNKSLEGYFIANLIKALIMIERGYVKKGLLILEDLKSKEKEPLYVNNINLNVDLIHDIYFGGIK